MSMTSWATAPHFGVLADPQWQHFATSTTDGMMHSTARSERLALVVDDHRLEGALTMTSSCMSCFPAMGCLAT